MAKKAPKRKAAAKPRKPHPPATRRARGNRPARTKNERQPSFEGMEQIRSAKLDGICEDIGEGRDTINRIKREEKDSQKLALQDMHARSVTVYRHAGVTLMRVPGEEKLVVKTTKGADATTTVDAGESTGSAAPSNGGESGTSADAPAGTPPAPAPVSEAEPIPASTQF